MVLARFAGRSDVVFGNVVSGRSLSLRGIESLVGMCVNTLPLRVTIPAAGPIAPWLQRMHREAVAAAHFEDTALASVRHWAEIDPEEPLFDSVLGIENYPFDTSAVADSSVACGSRSTRPRVPTTPGTPSRSSFTRGRLAGRSSARRRLRS